MADDWAVVYMVMDDMNNGGRSHGRGHPRPICGRKCQPSIYPSVLGRVPCLLRRYEARQNMYLIS